MSRTGRAKEIEESTRAVKSKNQPILKENEWNREKMRQMPNRVEHELRKGAKLQHRVRKRIFIRFLLIRQCHAEQEYSFATSMIPSDPIR